MILTWESVNWISQLLLVIFAGVALISGTIVNRRQSKQLIELETRLAEQREKTARAEKSARDALTAAVVPRHFTLEAKEEAKKILRQGPKERAEISWIPNNLDAELLADDIREILEGGGWSVIQFGPDTDGGRHPSGTQVSWRSREDIPSWIENLRRAMAAGWPGCGRVNWAGVSGATEDSPIAITVGPKM